MIRCGPARQHGRVRWSDRDRQTGNKREGHTGVKNRIERGLRSEPGNDRIDSDTRARQRENLDCGREYSHRARSDHCREQSDQKNGAGHRLGIPAYRCR